MRSFTNKGRFRELMENTAVAVILDSETALLGAAIRARRELDGSGTD
jgi:glucokinase